LADALPLIAFIVVFLTVVELVVLLMHTGLLIVQGPLVILLQLLVVLRLFLLVVALFPDVMLMNAEQVVYPIAVVHVVLKIHIGLLIVQETLGQLLQDLL
jgi:hypothetical protein